MASVLSDDIRYVKLILLLVKGGTYVAKKHVIRITSSEQITIDAFLQKHQSELDTAKQKKLINRRQMDILFPRQSAPTDLDCWDISLLSYILLNLLNGKLESYEKDALAKLRDKRNELAHSASTTLTEGQFLGEWTHLIMVLFQLRRQLAQANQDEYDVIVVNISTINDFHVASNELKSFEGSDEFVHEVITKKLKSLEQSYEELAKRVQKLENQMVINQEIKLKVDVSAPTSAIRDTAEEELLNVAKSRGSVEQDQENGVQTAYNNLVLDVEKHDVDITNAEKGSVLITCRCKTALALKNLMQYVKDSVYEERLHLLQDALSKKLDNPIELNINIVLETVYFALEQIGNDK